VNQILDFRKFDQNKEKLNLAKTEMVSFVDNICASFRILANNKVKLEFESEFAQLNMSVDVDKVGKIVNNLLSNAYKFTPNGGKIVVSLRAKTRYEMKGGDHDMLCISVADNGKGISDAEKKNVFDRFYQVNGTEMQPAGGSGIGLNLVKKFAELHGGKVSVHDNTGGGSVFVVELPIDDDGAAKVNAHLGTMRAAPVFTTVHGGDEETSSQESGDASASLYGMARPQKQKVETADSVHKPILLLVDDSDDFREFMRDLLSDYTVVEAVNGQDAWNKIIDHRPDIILSDVMMPVMDGNELCRQVKENDETASIPFVMLTARLADEHRKEGLMSGADEYITKPFNIDMLNLRLRNLLNLVKRMGTVAKPTGEVVKEKQLNNGQFVLGAADRKFIEDIDLYIRDNMSNPDTSVESMSAHLCISRVQLYKRMISLMGTTPSEYLRAKRIKYAEHLLHSNEYNISEIAYKVGFNNPRYFSKYFQEAYGVTPSQYKKNLEAQE
jgi:CheY-like chemotaxis protein/two-component sensor histidine kinase